MDIATIFGITIAIASLVGGFVMDGGKIGGLYQPTALIIVFGGTIGATLTSVSLKDFFALGKYIKVSMFGKAKDPLVLIEMLVTLSAYARREGLLALEERVENLNDDFVKTNLRLVIDGIEEAMVQGIMEIEISNIESRHKRQASFFDMAGGFAPTMGIIGTVMGLIHVLGSLSDVLTLGPKIATAFTATLYGVASANVLWHPLANKLKHRNYSEGLYYEIAAEGILSIQAGESPNALRDKLISFLSRTDRSRLDKMGQRGQDQLEAQAQ
ncbi:flagellar motor protein [Alicyclobacillus ferrooxydans]|uniref:Flagellar motor protein MotA n=1 Tax=Alicyclobacillus ferrooxydans TaxID=471514 RepID=A0A0P9D4M1_9BACL|nr:flagellar motor protein [Alicyclobacillus ferrooxydans]KPV44400.1 flagellar motor protein MotA [Alicyclobacillus ferrooxydans]